MGLKLEDVAFNMGMLFEIVGEEKYIEISKMYGGNSIYIPTYASVIRNQRNRDIIRRYNGVNAVQLGREYNITANQVIRIVKENKN